MILTIGGVAGSGKTSVAKILAEKLGLTFYSMGGLRAKMASERGLTIDQLNVVGEEDKTTDTNVDDYQKRLGETEDNLLIEGHISWYFLPKSFKVFLTCDPKESAQRIYKARHATEERNDEPVYESLEHTEQEIAKRKASDSLRYQKFYGVADHQDPSHYDLVIDTTSLQGPEATASEILKVLAQKELIPVSHQP